jgi:hypothetical protein
MRIGIVLRVADLNRWTVKSIRPYAIATYLVVLVAGCSNWDVGKAPAGFGVIREHVVSAPGNDPPISSTFDYSIVEIDGKPVSRETIPPWIDMVSGALVSAGSHEFKALVSPHLRPLNHQPAKTVFRADVQSTKVYYLVDKEGGPVLIEAKGRQR